MVWRVLTFFALIISIAALVMAVMAYQRAGGDLMIRQRVESLHQVVQSARQETANALDRLEKLVRGYREKRVGAEDSREK